MKVLKIFGLACVLLALTVSAQAQFVQDLQDRGAADTMDFVISVAPDVATSQFKLQADFWVFNDSNDVVGAGAGWTWDNPYMLMDSAAMAPDVEAGFDALRLIYDRGYVDTTNLYHHILFTGAKIFRAGVPMGPTRRRWASYYFTLSQWGLTDSVIIDTLAWDEGSEIFFLGPVDTVWVPFWPGRVRVRDSAYKPPSNLILSTQELSFVAAQGQPAPPNQQVQITSDDSPLPFTVEENVSWLLKSPSSGTTPANINVGVNIVGLAVGTYVDSLAIVAPKAANNPQYVVVHLTVEPPPPTIGVNANSFLFKAVLDGENPPTQQLNITNTGGSTLNWIATKSESWLSIDPTSGVNSGSISLDVDITGLPWGEYYDIIEITDPNATNSPVEVEVHLSLASGLPEIGVDPQTVYVIIELPSENPPLISGPPPLDVPPAHFTINNVGGGTLEYTLSESSSFISGMTPATGTAPQEVEVTFNIPSTTLAGTYTDTVWVTSVDATNSPYPVVFKFRAAIYPQQIYCNKDTVRLSSYECVDGSINSLPSTDFMISNAGGDNPMIVNLLYESDYFFVDTTVGRSPATFHLYPKDGTIPQGVYYDTIWASSVWATNNPYPVLVRFEVLPDPSEPAIYVLPDPEYVVIIKEESGPAVNAGCRVFNEHYGCMDWAYTGGAPWATPSRTSGGVPGFIGFIIDPTGYPMGSYVDSFYVTSSTATNGPYKVPMRMNVWRYRGDANWDGKINLLDLTYIIGYVYMGGIPPQPGVFIGDVNCDGKINLTDIAYLIGYIYLGGEAPCD